MLNKKSVRTFVIGDVHGCYDSLVTLLDKINFTSSSDRIIFVGDVINRGGQCLDTLKLLYKLRDSIDIILGNHDLHLLCRFYNYVDAGKSDTLDEILHSDKSKKLINWLRTQSLSKRIKINKIDFLITHAGLPPMWSFSDVEKYTKEINKVFLDNKKYDNFLKNMYGNTPNLWSKNLRNIERYRCIVNYLTRMRYCYEDFSLEFKIKSNNINDEEKKIVKWFKLKNKKLKDNQIVIFGHWASLKGITNNKQYIAIDTGCVWGRKLSAYQLETQKIYSVNKVLKL